ncbi:MAG: sodium/proton-translocating pyrophosphatase, partial [Chloroflexia bacterium]
MSLLAVPILSSLLAISVATTLFFSFRRAKIRFQRMAEIAGDIAVGVRAYLTRQLRTILFVAPILAVGIYLMLGPWVTLTFCLGVLTSLTTILLGMNAAVRANAKTADLATDSPVQAFFSAIGGGAVMGFSITGFSVLVLAVLYGIFRDPAPLVGFGFGASLAALFAQIGGGIYTKSADVGADLVGKVEKNIPEDDPRNPAVVADLVGDNVGDCAGRGSDLFESLSDDIITGTIVSLLYLSVYGERVVFFPLLLQSVGLLSSLIGILAMRQMRRARPEAAFQIGMGVNAVAATLGSWLLCHFLLHDDSIFLACFLGVLTTLVVSIFTRYYAGAGGRPVRRIAQASKRGAALNVITGLAAGLQSPLASILMIVFSVCVSFVVAHGSLLAIVGVNIGTDLLIGYIMTADAFGPITDNAAGIAEMSGAGTNVVHSLS